MDKYPLKLEVKGGVVNALFKIVIITTNKEPSAWYTDDIARGRDREPERQALYRRLGIGSVDNDALRYIRADSRPELHAKIRHMFSLCPCPVSFNAGSEIMKAPPAAPTLPQDENEDEEIEPPPLLRRKANLHTQITDEGEDHPWQSMDPFAPICIDDDEH